MKGWRAWLRAGLALFGIAFAVFVYFAIGRRAPASVQDGSGRTDPKAIAESTGGETLAARGAMRNVVAGPRALRFRSALSSMRRDSPRGRAGAAAGAGAAASPGAPCAVGAAAAFGKSGGSGRGVANVASST